MSTHSPVAGTETTVCACARAGTPSADTDDDATKSATLKRTAAVGMQTRRTPPGSQAAAGDRRRASVSMKQGFAFLGQANLFFRFGTSANVWKSGEMFSCNFFS
ncbi:MAG TPA: hypothetical protein VN909_06900 [Candidatus Dormibacteraeota bacterium]|nr:hypothetical protein [Candidatus Dormibacteraeota bacterium]